MFYLRRWVWDDDWDFGYWDAPKASLPELILPIVQRPDADAPGYRRVEAMV